MMVKRVNINFEEVDGVESQGGEHLVKSKEVFVVVPECNGVLEWLVNSQYDRIQRQQ